jgi:hypothetical protein
MSMDQVNTESDHDEEILCVDCDNLAIPLLEHSYDEELCEKHVRENDAIWRERNAEYWRMVGGR